LLLMGVWWTVFSIPTFLYVRDKRRPPAHRQHMLEAGRQAMGEVTKTLRNVGHYRELAIFLVAFLLFNDGVQTMITQAGVFAQRVLAMETAELVQVILMIQFVALPGAIAVGWLADRVGQKLMLIVCLLVWIVLLVAAFFITTRAQFWVMAAFAALVLGGTQSVARAIMGLMTPEKRTGEFFGFFNLSGKATSMFGPVIFAQVLTLSDSAHLAILSLLGFFVFGLLIVLFVDVAEGQRLARAEDALAKPEFEE
jgi:UMF1 family MFS transporter